MLCCARCAVHCLAGKLGLESGPQPHSCDPACAALSSPEATNADSEEIDLGRL